MAIWENPDILSGEDWKKPEILSGESPQVAGGESKATLALCMPHQENVTMEWSLAFRNLILPPHKYFLNRGMPWDVARESMVTGAIADPNVKYVMFLDSDNTLIPDAVETLIKISEEKNLDIVSALYWTRKHGMDTPAAWKIGVRDGANVQFLPIDPAFILEHIKKASILEVDVTGLGCCLIRTDVFRRLQKSNPNKPFFQWGVGRKDENGKPLIQCSEDFWFFLRCVDELNVHPHIALITRSHHICHARKSREDGHLELIDV